MINQSTMTIKKQCNHAGCRALVPYNEQYCSKHEKPKQVRKYDYKKRKENEGKYFLFYKGKKWRQMSYNYRLNHPICENCIENGIIVKSDMVDHVEEIRDNWERRYDETNLKALCWSCHNSKTNRVRQERNKK